MAVVRVCQNLTSTHSCCLSRPVSFAAFLSREKQLSRSLKGPWSRCSYSGFFSPPLFTSFFSHLVPMKTDEKPYALSDQTSKASSDPEDQQGGGSGDNGFGSGHGDAGHGGDDSPDDYPKGTDSGPFFGWYLLLLNKHPVTTKAFTSALLTLFGDLVCQLIIEKSERINFTRLGIFTLLGLLLVGPTLHFWYLTLSKLVPGPGTFRAGARLVLDQFLFSPIFIGVFISALMTLEGHSYDIVPKLKQDWLNVVVANWKIWIPFQFLNFLLVPQQLQVLVANVIALAWNTYLSFATHKDIISPARKDSIAS